MKIFLSAILFTISLGASAQSSSEFYKAVKTMLKSADGRVSAVFNNDYKKACNFTEQSSGTDTKIFYISFEALESNDVSSKLQQELSVWVVRNLHSMHKQGLPLAFHQACMKNDVKKLQEVANQINNISNLESVGF